MNYIVNNCQVDSVREYALATTNNSNSVANITVTNSSFSYMRRFIDHRSPGSNSITIEDCTFFKVVAGGVEGAEPNYFIDLNTADSGNPIVIKNSIFGPGWNEGGGDYVRGFRAGAATTLSATNSYSTSDYLSTNATYQLSGILGFAGTSYSIFADPDNGDFTITSASFPGNDNAGDPRWRQD
ncbi:MAG: DUF5123 domain-containing protein [Bacteroidia bacterium]|nr:DUF5123 domain-containing protein [Bacteroidia bacterium]